MKKYRILKFPLLLLMTQVYFSCSAPFAGLAGLVGLSAVSSLLLDDEKPKTLVVDEIRSPIYEIYIQEVCQNIRDESKIRQATIWFINQLSKEQANRKLCRYYDFSPNNEDKLTIGQMLIFIYCFVRTPRDWDGRFKRDVLAPLGLTTPSRIREELKRQHSDVINQTISRLA